jgi:hypothetical protein
MWRKVQGSTFVGELDRDDEFHGLALSTGTVLAWGLNDDGQATPPAGLSGVVAITAGLYHGVAPIGTPFAPCLVDISLSYAPGVLSITQTIGSTAARDVYRSASVSIGGVTALATPRGFAAMAPPQLFPASIPMGSVGTVGGLVVGKGPIVPPVARVDRRRRASGPAA